MPMVQIKPFRGLRYNPQQAGDWNDLTAPPYDVISPKEQVALHEKSTHNIVRLILGLKNPSDNDANNVYTRARETLEAWREAGIVQSEGQPAIYAYTQSWNGIERRGFIAALQVSPYESGEVLPHEFTLGGPKADRLALTQTTGCILSPIFCLYHDPDQQAEVWLFNDPSQKIPPVEVTDSDGVFHRFWPVTEPQTLVRLQQLLASRSALIADGHHRYETALAHQAWRRERDGMLDAPKGSLPWDYTMAFFANMADEGLRVYPTHRVFTAYPAEWNAEKLTAALSQNFQPAPNDSEALFWTQTSEGHKQAWVLKPEAERSALPELLQTLDVAILDTFVFQGILGQTANDLKQQHYLQFIRDEAEIAELLRTQPETLVFWVHAPDVEQVRQICESGLRMPQKSTYFYPKLLSGLVMYYYGPQGVAFNPLEETSQPVSGIR